ncbi:MAG: hypothetical protein M1321_03130 [Candidatus Marsarchaeota archaeon]|nr:hypothetical protein [Candidatus Marsarchaeota archaeon]
MLYLVYGSLYFPKSNEIELRRLFGEYTTISRFLNMHIIRARNINIKSGASGARFIYRILKLQFHSRIEESDYLNSIMRALEGSRITEKRMKIECIDILSRRGYSAKDIEVFLGRGLEGNGANIDIANPEVLCYVVLFRMECYIGFISYSQLRFIDPGRHYKQLSNGISRAEFKIMQAFDEFRIRTKSGIALDLGAAPGGWTSYLAKRGMKVIAVDKGRLDYDAFNRLGISICVPADGRPEKADVDMFDVIDIKSGFGGASLGSIGKLSMIACDMNVSPEETAAALLRFSRYLKKNGIALATIKCTTRNIEKYVGIAAKELEGEFIVKGVRVLPSNRQEATLFAVKEQQPHDIR